MCLSYDVTIPKNLKAHNHRLVDDFWMCGFWLQSLRWCNPGCIAATLISLLATSWMALCSWFSAWAKMRVLKDRKRIDHMAWNDNFEFMFSPFMMCVMWVVNWQTEWRLITGEHHYEKHEELMKFIGGRSKDVELVISQILKTGTSQNPIWLIYTNHDVCLETLDDIVVCHMIVEDTLIIQQNSCRYCLYVFNYILQFLDLHTYPKWPQP